MYEDLERAQKMHELNLLKDKINITLLHLQQQNIASSGKFGEGNCK